MKSAFNHFHVCITRINCFLAKKTRIPDEKEIDGNIHKIHGKKTNRNRNRKTKQTFSNIHENDGLVENIFKFKNFFLRNFTEIQILIR